MGQSPEMQDATPTDNDDYRTRDNNDYRAGHYHEHVNDPYNYIYHRHEHNNPDHDHLIDNVDHDDQLYGPCTMSIRE